MRKFFLLISVFAFFSFTATSLKKRISDRNFRYEFYTTDKSVNLKQDREYYWFKGGLIHNSEYGMAGELLHDEYLKLYHSNQLAEAGTYKYGLKEGYWKTWYETGALQSKTYWDEGQKDGSYYSYDPTGFLTEEGHYKNNRKHGRWINYISTDTMQYRKGQLVHKKVKDTTPGFIKRLFIKKKERGEKADSSAATTDLQKGEKEKNSAFRRLFSKKKAQDSNRNSKNVKEDKKLQHKEKGKNSWFNRLFGKSKSEKKDNG